MQVTAIIITMTKGASTTVVMTGGVWKMSEGIEIINGGVPGHAFARKRFGLLTLTLTHSRQVILYAGSFVVK